MNIIERAKQAGIRFNGQSFLALGSELERFAALVRAEERERIAKAIDQCEDHERAAYYAALIRGMKDEA